MESVNRKRRTKRILFLDDMLTLAETLADLSRFKGYFAETASYAREALNKIKNGRYDAIVMDCGEDSVVNDQGEMLSQVLIREYPEIMRIAITGEYKIRHDPKHIAWRLYDAVFIKGEIEEFETIYKIIDEGRK